MAGVVVYVLWLAGMAWTTSYLTAGAARWVAAWQWLVPFTAATVAYTLASAAVVGSNYPWLFEGAVLAFGIASTARNLQHALRRRDVASIWKGYYGVTAALFGQETRGQRRATPRAPRPRCWARHRRAAATNPIR